VGGIETKEERRWGVTQSQKSWNDGKISSFSESSRRLYEQTLTSKYDQIGAQKTSGRRYGKGSHALKTLGKQKEKRNNGKRTKRQKHLRPSGKQKVTTNWIQIS